MEGVIIDLLGVYSMNCLQKNKGDNSMKKDGDKKEISENKELKILWEDRSSSYNYMFEYLKKQGLKKKELNEFSRLLSKYIRLI